MKLVLPSPKPSLVFDVGSANTLILGPQKNILAYEPTLLLLDQEQEVLLVGEEAKAVTSDERLVRHVSCVDRGYVSHEAYMVTFLSHIHSQIPRDPLSFFFPRSIGVAVPSSFSTEQALLWNRVYRRLGYVPWYYPSSVGIAQAYRIKDDRPSPQLVLECGASQVEVSVVELGKVIHTASYPQGGKALDQLIQLHVFQTLGLIVPLQDVAAVKISVAGTKHSHVARGKDAKTSQITSRKLTAEQLDPPVERWRAGLRDFLSYYLSDIPPSLLSSIMREGILFAGGGSGLAGLGEYLQQSIGCPVYTISRPQLAGALGIHTVMSGALQDAARVGR